MREGGSSPSRPVAAAQPMGAAQLKVRPSDCLRPPGHALGKRIEGDEEQGKHAEALGQRAKLEQDDQADQQQQAPRKTRRVAHPQGAAGQGTKPAVRVTRRSMSRSHMSLTTHPAARITRAAEAEQNQQGRPCGPAVARARRMLHRPGRNSNQAPIGRSKPAQDDVGAHPRRTGAAVHPVEAMSVHPGVGPCMPA